MRVKMVAMDRCFNLERVTLLDLLCWVAGSRRYRSGFCTRLLFRLEQDLEYVARAVANASAVPIG